MNAKLIGQYLFITILTSAAASATPSLGAASWYNVFALGNLTQLGGDSEGAVAVAGSANITNMAVNANNVSGPWGFVVGGSLQASNGSLNGNLAYGGSASRSNFTLNNGTATNASPIDFISARIDLEAKSAYWASSISSAYLGNVTYFNWGGVSLAGTNSTLNVFNIDGSRVRSTLTISAPAGSTVLVNVSGTTNNWSGFQMQPSGVDRTRMLFNFFESTSLSISAMSFQGTVFAPKANLNLYSGNIEGNTVANNITATAWSGEFHNQPFAGSVPYSVSYDAVATPEPATLLTIGAALVGLARLAQQKGRHTPKDAAPFQNPAA